MARLSQRSMRKKRLEVRSILALLGFSEAPADCWYLLVVPSQAGYDFAATVRGKGNPWMNEGTGRCSRRTAGAAWCGCAPTSPSVADDDETDVRRLNQELRRRVTELETLFELVPVGLAIARDSECRHIEPNPAFRRLLRLPLDANASRSAPPDQRPANFRVLQDGVELAPQDLPMQVVVRHRSSDLRVGMPRGVRRRESPSPARFDRAPV